MTGKKKQCPKSAACSRAAGHPGMCNHEFELVNPATEHAKLNGSPRPHPPTPTHPDAQKWREYAAVLELFIEHAGAFDALEMPNIATDKTRSQPTDAEIALLKFVAKSH